MPKIQIAKTTDIENGSMKTFDVGDKKITIAHIDGSFFAFDDTCTHQKCSLGEGFLDGKTVICPCHGGTFDVTDGHVVSLPPTTNVGTYPIHLENEYIFIEA
jgi:nitrite reductase/ring-hydroxylating ferredoxin subunit